MSKEPASESSGKPPASTASTSTGAGSTEPIYRPFQLAQEAFISDLGAVWNDVQRRFQDLQFDYCRSYTQTSQSQFQKDFFTNQKESQAIHEKFRKDFDALVSDPAPRKRCQEAYAKYKDSVKKALADLNTAALDPATLSLVGQSMSWVAQVAAQLESPWFFGAFAPPDSGSSAAKT